ncbi:MAG: hypothetical protein IPH45_21345, partial [Bacteroidales bacterium]|nr:hypothetical protein [Bacteroidales bacterium]
DPPYSLVTTTDAGITTTTLTIDPTPITSNNNEYRAVFGNSSGDAISNSAGLIVQTSVGGSISG